MSQGFAICAIGKDSVFLNESACVYTPNPRANVLKNENVEKKADEGGKIYSLEDFEKFRADKGIGLPWRSKGNFLKELKAQLKIPDSKPLPRDIRIINYDPYSGVNNSNRCWNKYAPMISTDGSWDIVMKAKMTCIPGNYY